MSEHLSWAGPKKKRATNGQLRERGRKWLLLLLLPFLQLLLQHHVRSINTNWNMAQSRLFVPLPCLNPIQSMNWITISIIYISTFSWSVARTVENSSFAMAWAPFFRLYENIKFYLKVEIQLPVKKRTLVLLGLAPRLLNRDGLRVFRRLTTG